MWLPQTDFFHVFRFTTWFLFYLQQFGIQNKTTGKALFDQIISTTGIRENWYFGLQYIDRRNQPAWLNMKDKVLKQDIKKDGIIYKLDFKFRFYPENVADEVIQDVTLKSLFVQVRSTFRPRY